MGTHHEMCGTVRLGDGREVPGCWVDMDCENETWAAENGGSVEWARTMWHCPCPKCAQTTGSTCRLCGEPVHVDGSGVVTHRDGMGSHQAEVLA